MARLIAAAVLSCLLIGAPAAEASKRSEARRYAAAIGDYIKAEPAAIAASTPAYHVRRDAVAAGCLDVVVDGAPHQFFSIVLLYAYWAARPVVESIQPETDRLVRRLRRIPTRSRPLRRARRAHARRNREFRRIPALLPDDLCAVLAEWQRAGWSDAAEPASSEQLLALSNKVFERDEAAIERGAKFLRRHGVSGRVATVFEDGVDDGLDSLLADDPVGQAIEDAVNP